MMFENWLREERIIVRKLFEKEYPKEANMDAVKFVVEQARMCNSQAEDTECESCDLNNSEYCTKLCDSLISQAGAEEAVKIVKAWSEVHPISTLQNAFLKQWPTARLDANGIVDVCPAYIDARKRDESTGGCRNITNCYDCRRDFWMQEVE